MAALIYCRSINLTMRVGSVAIGINIYPTMIIRPSLFIFLFLFCGVLLAGDIPRGLSDLQTKMENKINDLELSYFKRLTALKIKLTKANRLPEANQVASAIKDIKLNKLRINDDYSSSLKLTQLKRLKSHYAKEGDLESVNMVQEIVDVLQTKAFADDGLCHIEVEATTDFEVKPLKEGSSRLSRIRGGAKIDFVSETLTEAFYTRLRWRAKPSFTFTARSTGNVYILKHRKEKASSPKMKHVTSKMLGGQFLHLFKTYRVHLEAGQTFKCSGYEICLIADKISKR